jgi:hypothetical protein
MQTRVLEYILQSNDGRNRGQENPQIHIIDQGHLLCLRLLHVVTKNIIYVENDTQLLQLLS